MTRPGFARGRRATWRGGRLSKVRAVPETRGMRVRLAAAVAHLAMTAMNTTNWHRFWSRYRHVGQIGRLDGARHAASVTSVTSTVLPARNRPLRRYSEPLESLTRLACALVRHSGDHDWCAGVAP